MLSRPWPGAWLPLRCRTEAPRSVPLTAPSTPFVSGCDCGRRDGGGAQWRAGAGIPLLVCRTEDGCWPLQLRKSVQSLKEKLAEAKRELSDEAGPPEPQSAPAAQMNAASADGESHAVSEPTVSGPAAPPVSMSRAEDVAQQKARLAEQKAHLIDLKKQMDSKQGGGEDLTEVLACPLFARLHSRGDVKGGAISPSGVA